jgi:pyridoxine 5-phosphate synthase
MAFLCVNIDHIATLRQARREDVPDPIEAAKLVEKAGACGVTVHLREDRRHIQDEDVFRLRKSVKTKLNLEMAATDEMVKIALKVRPDQATLVPEKRQELTTEGGLAVEASPKRFEKTIDCLQKAGIPVSLFILPEPKTIEFSARLGATYVELHTGRYSHAVRSRGDIRGELLKLACGAKLAHLLGLKVHAGHGLTYENTYPVASFSEIEDLNIGHNIIARAAMVGLEKAVKEMLAILKKARFGKK